MKRTLSILLAPAAAAGAPKPTSRAPSFQDGVPYPRKERSVARTANSFMDRRASIVANANSTDVPKVLATNRKFQELSQTAGLVPTDEIIFSLIIMNVGAQQYTLAGELFAQLVREGRFPIPPHLLGPALDCIRHVTMAIPADQAWIQKYVNDLTLFLPQSQLMSSDVQKSVSTILLPLVDGLCKMGILNNGDSDSAFNMEAFNEDYGYLFQDAQHTQTFYDLLTEIAVAASALGNEKLLKVAAASINSHLPRLLAKKDEGNELVDDLLQLVLIGAAHLPLSAETITFTEQLLHVEGMSGEDSLAALARRLPKSAPYMQIVVDRDFDANASFVEKAHELLTAEEFSMFGWHDKCQNAELAKVSVNHCCSVERTALHLELLNAIASTSHPHLSQCSAEDRLESLDQLASQILEGYCVLIRRHLEAAAAPPREPAQDYDMAGNNVAEGNDGVVGGAEEEPSHEDHQAVGGDEYDDEFGEAPPAAAESADTSSSSAPSTLTAHGDMNATDADRLSLLDETLAIQDELVNAEIPQLVGFSPSIEGRTTAIHGRTLLAWAKTILVTEALAKKLESTLSLEEPQQVEGEEAPAPTEDMKVSEKLKEVREINLLLVDKLVEVTKLSSSNLEEMMLPEVKQERKNFVFTLIAEALISAKRTTELERFFLWMIARDSIAEEEKRVSVAVSPVTYAAAMSLAEELGCPTLAILLRDSRWRMAAWDPLSS